MILQLENLEAAYGMSQVLFGVNLDVREKQVTCLLGRNGVGKSTTIKTIMGVLKPRAGNIRYKGTEIGGMVPNKINRLGVAYVPQGRQVFPTLTGRENIIFGERKPKEKRTKVWTLDEIYELFPRLKERQNFMGDRISGGEQQMMVIARALMQNPDLLLLDEICEGLAPIVVQELAAVIPELCRQGVSVLLVEQSAKFALEVSSTCYIMEKGAVVHSDETKNISDEVFKKYMGT